MYSFLAFLSAVGLFLSACCHLLSWVHVEPPGGEAAFVLHVGIFLVWVPLVFCSKRAQGQSGRQTRNQLLEGLPGWVQGCVSTVFAYAMVNFVLFMILASQYPKHEVPLYLELRGFSGHWILFYTVALTGFIGLRRKAAGGER
jgi:hypothetical protein